MFDRGSRGRYSTDASIYQTDPIGVLIPKNIERCARRARYLSGTGLPLVARGAGTSQCGQTVGEALVIDNSKYLNQVLDFDLAAMTVTVEPGIVLDHLNAWLKPHGVWFPVDVSTAAQCTIGGMAGNNSCGSRSIAYGNMVHNVVSIDALLADGTEATFGKEADMQGVNPRIATIMSTLREIATREHEEIERMVPKVLRRVGGYNIDIFDPQSATALHQRRKRQSGAFAGGQRRHAGLDATDNAKLAPLPAHKALGVVNFPTFYQPWILARHIVKLGPARSNWWTAP